MTMRIGKRLAGGGSICFAFGLVALQLGGCATSPRGGSAYLAETAPDNHGIEVLGLRQASAGYMIDFRYRVLDPDKAAPLLDHKIQPYLLDPASGAKLFVPSTPKLGQLRQTPKHPVAGDRYFMFFANPGRYAQPGSRLTLVAGDLRLENLTVQ